MHMHGETRISFKSVQMCSVYTYNHLIGILLFYPLPGGSSQNFEDPFLEAYYTIEEAYPLIGVHLLRLMHPK